VKNGALIVADGTEANGGGLLQFLRAQVCEVAASVAPPDWARTR
jgi:hypothetical protein